MTPTYRSLNKVMTLAGCDRRLFLSGLFVGLGMLLCFASLTFGLVIFATFAVLGWFHAKDPVVLRAVINAGRQRAEYDAAKPDPFPVIYGDYNE